MAIPQATASASRRKPRRHEHKHAWKHKHYRWVPDGDCGWRVQGYVVRHKHKPRRNHRRNPRPAGAYQGPFGPAQTRRLLDRAGFGAVPGQAEQLAGLGLVGAVQSLTRPSGSAALHGPAPVDDNNDPIAPSDAYGHDHLWFLDRMVRSDRPLVERMTLVFHDWFATSNANVSRQQQLIDQSNLFRSACFGSFQRELRPRDDGAVLARRRPRRLQRERHKRHDTGAKTATTPTPTRPKTSREACARPARESSPSSATSRRAASPTGS